ncbi:MAG TPA: hypothetical protein PK400_10410 [Phycisphaerales bacterium]|nr:hypothetical protein [Phycisphaerales bacterium]HRQ76507.1 hypothetical protein [Phycisphaerales bacterium]
MSTIEPRIKTKCGTLIGMVAPERHLTSVGALFGTLALVFTGSCAAPCATTSLKPIDDEPPQRAVVERRQQVEIRRAMASVAPDHVASPLPKPRMRWEDVAIAADYATTESEIAIVHMDKGDADHRLVFHLKTLDDRPGRLTVVRVDGPQVYTAEASIGRFGDDTQRAEQFLALFDRFMREFGAKRHIADRD